jgi:hypothetical protein
MAWIVDVELVEVLEGEGIDALLVVFDVIYPGETWCRSLVRLTGLVAEGTEHDMVARARDSLVALLDLESRPTSLDLRLTAEGPVVLGRGHPGD